MKNGHLPRCAGIGWQASSFGTALHLVVFEQPEYQVFFSNL
jgi:hypothetical protein